MSKRIFVMCMVMGMTAQATASPVGEPTVPVEATAPPVVPTPRFSLTLGYGNGAIGATDNEPTSQGASTTMQVGYRLSRKWELVLEGGAVGFARFSPDTDFAQQLGATTIALKWQPFARRPCASPGAGGAVLTLDASAVHLKAGMGVAHLIRTPYDKWVGGAEQGKWGGAVTAGVGWMPIQFGGSSLGLEVTGTAMVRDEMRYGISTNVLLRTTLF